MHRVVRITFNRLRLLRLLLHDGLTVVCVFPATGHLYLTLIHPTTRLSLRGMTLSSAREDWALQHHTKWVSETSLRL